jgi:amino acid permease
MSDSSDVEKVNYTAAADEKGYQYGGSDVVVEDHGADSELQRRLSTRHITMIALGSSIGMVSRQTNIVDDRRRCLQFACLR